MPKAVDLDFKLSNLIHNNLGGWGPQILDPQEMRYANIAEVDGTDIDLVIRVKPDTHHIHY
jgi:hypothetical protein